ncbi:ABC transporter permease [Naumannella huperziae]
MIAIQTVFNLGLSFIVARITDAIPDLRKIIGFVTRLWLFVSCVMFGPERVLRLPYGEIILNINPAFQVLDISRKLLIYDTMPEPRSWIILAAWSVVLFLIGFVYFWRGEVNYGRA